MMDNKFNNLMHAERQELAQDVSPCLSRLRSCCPRAGRLKEARR
jgi:hypothetical protein